MRTQLLTPPRLAVLAATLLLASSALAATSNYIFRAPAKGLKPAPITATPAGPFQFTTCGSTGTAGPNSAQCNAAYAGSKLAGLVSVTAGIQSWTVPQTGTYTVVLAGAKGGPAPYYPQFTNGVGAVLTTSLSLTQGTSLKILVGQAGSPNTLGYDAGGGGGTYLLSGATLLAVAGGGGGAGGSGGSGYNASVDTSHTLDFCGSCGPSSGWGGGGAGVTSNGIDGGLYGGIAYSFSNGGTASTAPNNATTGAQALGGFGGGGGGGWTGGGGGGGYTPSNPGGAGGNTYTSSTIVTSVASNNGPGYLTITLN